MEDAFRTWDASAGVFVLFLVEVPSRIQQLEYDIVRRTI